MQAIFGAGCVAGYALRIQRIQRGLSRRFVVWYSGSDLIVLRELVATYVLVFVSSSILAAEYSIGFNGGSITTGNFRNACSYAIKNNCALVAYCQKTRIHGIKRVASQVGLEVTFHVIGESYATKKHHFGYSS